MENKDYIYSTACVYDGRTEQSVELDLSLPDYYPEIFKILKCTVTPTIQNYTVSEKNDGSPAGSSNRLDIEGTACVKLLYISDDTANSGGTGRVHCISHRYAFTKSVGWSTADSVGVPAPDGKYRVTLSPHTDYVNCRAVSGRRFDLRATVTVQVKIFRQLSVQIASANSSGSTDGGDGIQTRTENILYCGRKIIGFAKYAGSDDIETGSRGEITVLSYTATPVVSEYKLLSDKIAVRGEVHIKALYNTARQSDDSKDADAGLSVRTEVLEAVLPVSQVVDMQGVTDAHNVFIIMNTADCQLEHFAGGSVLKCDITVFIDAVATRPENLKIITDAYSTEYETELKSRSVRLTLPPETVTSQYTVKAAADLPPSSGPQSADIKIADVWCVAESVSVSGKTDSGGGGAAVAVSGDAVFRFLSVNGTGSQGGGDVAFTEKQVPFEFEATLAPLQSGSSVQDFDIAHMLSVSGVSYQLTADGAVELRAQLFFKALVSGGTALNAVVSVESDRTRPKEKTGDFALKLCYTAEGESVWDIAKRYNVSPEAVAAENDIQGTETPAMLLIPIS